MVGMNEAVPDSMSEMSLAQPRCTIDQVPELKAREPGDESAFANTSHTM